MDTNEYIDVEDRLYLSPTTSRDEQLSFIDTLRETMSNNLGQINQGTYALGSQLPSNLGGLGGAEATFQARYQTPQLNATAANLRSAAQATALNTALSNLQNVWKKRYNDAVLNYQRRAATPSTTGGSGSTPEDGSSLFDTKTLGQSYAKLNEAAKQAYEQLQGSAMNQAFADAAKASQQGGQSANTEVYMTKVNGVPTYITVYRDELNKVTGLKTADANYDAAGAQQFLRDLAKANNLFDNSGKQLNYTQVGI